MKTDAAPGNRAFITLRFAGEALDPREISEILPIEPSRAHRKGEPFVAGPHAGTLRGRTGVWFLATDGLVHSDALVDHFQFVERLLYPSPDDNGRILRLRDVLRRARARAYITCFGHGEADQTAPPIPASFLSAIAPLGAEIETDFAAEP